MDLLLVEVSGTNKFINNGLAYLAGSLAGKYSLQVIDLNYLSLTRQQLIDYIVKINPQVLGLSVKSANVSTIDNLISDLRGKIDSIIIVGGPHVSILGEEYLRANVNIDYGLKYEAENSLIDFLEFLAGRKRREEVPGLVYRDGSRVHSNHYSFLVDLDVLSFPSYDNFVGFDAVGYFRDHPYPLLTSRGCPYNCIYCSVKLVSGSIWRYRSIENIIKELQWAKDKYGIKSFELVDDNFTLDVNRAIKFCQSLIAGKINLSWGCPNGLRADKIIDELATVMRRSGCCEVSLGIESGSPVVFGAIKKGETLEDIERGAKILMANGIKVTGFFIVGLPGDNINRTKETIRFIRQLKLNGGVKWNFLIPYPQTELWDWIGGHGSFLRDFSLGKHFSRTGQKIVSIFETPDFSARERQRAWKIANLSIGAYHYIFKIPRNKILFKLKIFVYLLIYTPNVLWKKIRGNLKIN